MLDIYYIEHTRYLFNLQNILASILESTLHTCTGHKLVMSYWLQLYRVCFNRNISNARILTLANALGFGNWPFEMSLLKGCARSYTGACADTE